ncbi:hypothetical protein B0H19DRAFT_1239618 [Mycena capillaripes]|nr:hypothetical protein B0H19DRAFT_1239618 [Mycena capillaripes]
MSALVCRRWYPFRSEPTLWAYVELQGVLWSDGDNLSPTADALKNWLLRSSPASLHVQVIADADAPPLPECLFRLLRQHADRWETVGFCCALPGTTTSTITAPLLQAMELYTPKTLNWRTLNLNAANLRSVMLSASAIRAVPTLPVQQLETGMALEDVEPSDLATALSLASRLPSGASLRLDLSLDAEASSASLSGQQALTSRVAAFTWGVTGNVALEQSADLMQSTFSSLTLPELRALNFDYASSEQSGVDWAHEAFLQLCVRSRLDTALISLDLSNVRIGEDQFMVVLPLLQALRHLHVTDKGEESGQVLVLITQDVIGALTLDASHQYIPHLQCFRCSTGFNFEGQTLTMFALSRRDQGLTLDMNALPGAEAALEAAINGLERAGVTAVRTYRFGEDGTAVRAFGHNTQYRTVRFV